MTNDLTDSIAILLVNGGRDPKQKSWFELFCEKLDQNPPGIGHRLYVWNNNVSDDFVKGICQTRHQFAYFEPDSSEKFTHFHAEPLQRLYEAAKKDGFELIATIDSDAHPLRENWLKTIRMKLSGDCPLIGIWRDELSGGIDPYVHASFLLTSVDYVESFSLRFDSVVNNSPEQVMDTLSDFTKTAIENKLKVGRLMRSNKRNFHFLIGGIYSDQIYHHGAGSRANVSFWGGNRSSINRTLNTFIAEESANRLILDYKEYIGWLLGEQVSQSTKIKMNQISKIASEKISFEKIKVLWRKSIHSNWSRNSRFVRNTYE